MNAWKPWLHQTTTILGIAVCGGAASAWLLDQLTLKQAAAAAITGCISIAMKEIGVPVVVQGGQTTVQAENATVQPPAGSTTTVQAPKVQA